jgi:hypothetical protein
MGWIVIDTARGGAVFNGLGFQFQQKKCGFRRSRGPSIMQQNMVLSLASGAEIEGGDYFLTTLYQPGSTT